MRCTLAGCGQRVRPRLVPIEPSGQVLGASKVLVGISVLTGHGAPVHVADRFWLGTPRMPQRAQHGFAVDA
jgi:hypothetical protein